MAFLIKKLHLFEIKKCSWEVIFNKNYEECNELHDFSTKVKGLDKLNNGF